VTVTIDWSTLAAPGPDPRERPGQSGTGETVEPAVAGPGAALAATGARDLIGLYAARVEEAGRRSPVAALSPPAPIPFGRAVWQEAPSPVVETATAEQEDAWVMPRAAERRRRRSHMRWRFPVRGLAPVAGLRRLVTAAFVLTVLVAGMGQGALAQQRYRVQPGDTVESVAAEFGVDPAAILASSWVADPPNLQPGDVIVIPDPGQTPEEAAADAAAREGTSPWVAAAYYVEDGDTIEAIAATFDVDVEALVTFNGLDNPDLLQVGQRLLIPAQLDDATGEPVDGVAASGAGSGNSPAQWVPTHKQERNLSCEYASAFIATSAFGNGIPEQVFIDEVPPALNPHYGYRGDIDGAWGGYDDYGVYPEALVPVLNEWGFVGEVFYSMGDPTPLENHLDAGHPVIVWLALWGNTGVKYHDEDTYTVFAGEHVMVAYAYDAEGVYLSDPAHGSYKFMDWDTFTYVWGTSDGMSLAVYPM
jgi:LysM repeat protein/uncharacterized protein YvpB